MYYVYILYSEKCDRYYIGYSEAPERRLEERHNRGLVKATRNCYPYKIIEKKGFMTELEARQEELRIKRMKSRQYLEGLIRGGW